MIEIALIGAGNLGSRHLQALALLDRPTRIHLFEPSDQAASVALARYAEVARPDGPVRVERVAAIGALPATLDVAIVATSADVRREVVEHLVTGRNVRFLVLEKLLAQSLDDLGRLKELLGQAHVPAWVNCPRRQWDLYRALRNELVGASSLSISVSGSKWGLASNAVHFLDLLAFLGGEDQLSLAAADLLPGSVPSARPGFVDVLGRLSFRGPRERFASIASFADGNAPLVIEIASPTLHAQIVESSGRAVVRAASEDWQARERAVEVLYQSRLTHLVVQDLVMRGDCALTPLDASVHHHATFLLALGAHLELKQCPVT